VTLERSIYSGRPAATILGSVPWTPPTPVWEQAAESIRASIRDGRLRPGDRVPSATALAESLGVSRTTAVKAMTQLRTEGLIDTRPGYGSFVRTPSAPGTGVQVAAELRAISASLARLADALDRS